MSAVMPLAAGRGTTRERIVSQLRDQIVDGSLSPGFPLRTEEFMKRLGVSSSPLREAFVQLEAEGLVTVSPNRGASVTTLTQRDASDLLQVTALLWDAVARWTVPVLDADQVTRLRRAAGNFALALRSGDVRGGVLEAERFQSELLLACWSTELVRSVQAIRSRQQRVLRALATPETLDPIIDFHEAVLVHAGESSAEVACEALREVWRVQQAALGVLPAK